MKVFDNLLNYFGYEKRENRAIAPRKTDIDFDSDFTQTQPNLDYWTRRVRETVYVDDTDKLRYEEIDTMDREVPEITAALDANADFIIYPNQKDHSKMVTVSCPTNKKAQEKIEEIEKRVNIQEKLYSQIRAALKYGDNAEELVVSVDGKRFLGFRNIPIKTLVPVMIDGYPSNTPRVHQVIEGDIRASLNDNEVFHLSLNTDRARYSLYGKGVSMVESARLLYRQLRLMEEGMMITRLSRANQNYAMIVDVGELQGDEALSFLDTYKKKIMRRKYIDPKTGKFSWEYNPLSVIEDIMVPTRAGSGGNVVPLNNNANTGKDIEDVFYCQDKLIYSTGTPKIIIGKEVDINSKSTSDNQMGTFLRRVRRFQIIFTPDIKKLYRDVLAIEGVDVPIEELEVKWPSSLTVDEERKMSIEKIKCEVAKMLKIDLEVVDDEYIYKKILGMSEEEIETLKNRMELKKEEEEINSIDKPEGDEVEEPEGDEPKDKEELLKIIKNKLNDSDYAEWEKMQNIISNNPRIYEMVTDLIDFLQA